MGYEDIADGIMQGKIQMIETDVVLKLLQQLGEEAAHTVRAGRRIGSLQECLIVASKLVRT